MERKYFPGAIVDSMLGPRGTVLILVYVETKVITLFLNWYFRLLQGGAKLTGRWIEVWDRTTVLGNPPNTLSIPACLK
jgi:hypothetical protein